MIIATHGIVASQILTVPVATAATSVGDTSFTANWNAYSGATYYLLDVSTSSSFSSYVLQNQIVTSNSYNVTGLSSNTTYYYRVRASTTGDGDAELFFQRVNTAGGSLTTTEKSAVTTLVQDLKSYSIWSKMQAIYPMVGSSAAACAQNLKSSSFTGTFNGGITYASTGITGNGTTGYMDTGVTPSSHLNLNSVHLSYYSRTNNSENSSQFGANDGADNRLQITINFAGNTNYNAMNNNVTQFTYTGSSAGFFLASRISSTEFKSYRNSTLQNTTTSTTQTLTNKELILLATNNNGTKGQYSTKQCAFASVGDGLSDTEAGNFFTAVQAFQTTLSRNV